MRHGWFHIEAVQTGDRTLEEQLKGLGPLMDEVRDREVVELGCAEGLLLAECMRRGAYQAWGADVVPEAVAEANRQLSPWAPNAGASLDDLNDPAWPVPLSTEILLMLAILHKLRDPIRLVRRVLNNSTEIQLIVLRTPAATPGFVKDERSGFVVFDITGELQARGFELERVEKGHLDEYTGYFRRAA